MPLDTTTLNTLVTNLEAGETTLVPATAANTQAAAAAASASSALASAQTANQANVAALRAFVDGLDADGNSPAASQTQTTGDPPVPQATGAATAQVSAGT